MTPDNTPNGGAVRELLDRFAAHVRHPKARSYRAGYRPEELLAAYDALPAAPGDEAVATTSELRMWRELDANGEPNGALWYDGEPSPLDKSLAAKQGRSIQYARCLIVREVSEEDAWEVANRFLEATKSGDKHPIDVMLRILRDKFTHPPALGAEWTMEDAERLKMAIIRNTEGRAIDMLLAALNATFPQGRPAAEQAASEAALAKHWEDVSRRGDDPNDVVSNVYRECARQLRTLHATAHRSRPAAEVGDGDYVEASSSCPLCGWNKPHSHTPEELTARFDSIARAHGMRAFFVTNSDPRLALKTYKPHIYFNDSPNVADPSMKPSLDGQYVLLSDVLATTPPQQTPSAEVGGDCP